MQRILTGKVVHVGGDVRVVLVLDVVADIVGPRLVWKGNELDFVSLKLN